MGHLDNFESYFEEGYYYDKQSLGEDEELEVTADSQEIRVEFEGPDVDRERAEEVKRTLDNELDEVFEEQEEVSVFSGMNLFPSMNDQGEEVFTMVYTF